MQENERKRKLSKEAVDLVNEAARKEVDIKMENIIDTLAFRVSDYLTENKMKYVKEYNKEKNNFTDKLLRKYLPLQKQIANLEKTVLNEQIVEDEKFKKLDDMMTYVVGQKEEQDLDDFDEKKETYKSLKQIFNYLDTAINSYEEDLNNEICCYEKVIQNKEKRRSRS